MKIPWQVEFAKKPANLYFCNIISNLQIAISIQYIGLMRSWRVVSALT
jgi:hypothetical protein